MTLRQYRLEHGIDHMMPPVRRGKCSRCGEWIESDDRGFLGKLPECGHGTKTAGAEREDVALHKECFFDYILDRYTEAELASALGLEEVP